MMMRWHDEMTWWDDMMRWHYNYDLIIMGLIKSIKAELNILINLRLKQTLHWSCGRCVALRPVQLPTKRAVWGGSQVLIQVTAEVSIEWSTLTSNMLYDCTDVPADSHVTADGNWRQKGNCLLQCGKVALLTLNSPTFFSLNFNWQAII